MTEEQMAKSKRLRGIANEINDIFGKHEVELGDAAFIMLYMLGVVRIQSNKDTHEFWEWVGNYGYELDCGVQLAALAAKEKYDGIN